MMTSLFSMEQFKRKLVQAKNGCLSSKNVNIICDGSLHFEGTFRRAIWPFLVIGQLYGVMPVDGVSSRSLSDLHFNWKSYSTIYAIIVAIVLLSYCTFLLSKLFTDAESFSITNFLFYAMGTIEFISFLVLSMHWPQLMKHWECVEALPIFRNFEHKTVYIRRIRLISSTVLFFALVEHCLFVGVSIKLHKYLAFLQRNPPPNLIAILFGYVCENATFVWNFIDIFIVVFGIGLTMHFKVLNNELERAKLEIENLSINWIQLRSQYTKLCELVALVDEKISHFVLLSFSNNLFMICQQLFKSLRPTQTCFSMVYFWYSLIFLILRTFAVSLLTASIDDESRKPLSILRKIPSHLWNEETKRFRGDILCRRVALSGMEFFYVTRQFILSVTGTIITYELVLMQFNRI